MADVIHHRHTDMLEVPSRVYWSAGIGLALLTLALVIFSMTGNTHVASVAPALMEPTLPLVPFIPMM